VLLPKIVFSDLTLVAFASHFRFLSFDIVKLNQLIQQFSVGKWITGIPKHPLSDHGKCENANCMALLMVVFTILLVFQLLFYWSNNYCSYYRLMCFCAFKYCLRAVINVLLFSENMNSATAMVPSLTLTNRAKWRKAIGQSLTFFWHHTSLSTRTIHYLRQLTGKFSSSMRLIDSRVTSLSYAMFILLTLFWNK
jgi:hypothetical protein